jgi:hypothetical protein
MPETTNVEQPTPAAPNKPDWLKGMSPQAELIKIWNDVFESNCQCDICVRLRKALSEVKGGPPTQPGFQP